MKEPKISVIIPIYNVVKYLQQCVDCVLSQTFQDFEVILVDDGSTDGSSEFCDKILLKDSRIKVIHKKNEGSGPTRSRGLTEAKGEYIIFHDSDDFFKSDMYDNLYNIAKNNNADLVFAAAIEVTFDNKTGGYKEREISCKEVNYKTQQECRDGVMELFPTSMIFDVPWNKLYRRQIAVDNGLRFRPLRRCQDAVWNLDFYNHCSRVVSTDKAYYYYRQNTQESTWRKFPKDYIDIQIFYFHHLRQILTSWGVYDREIKEHYDTSFLLAIESCANMYDNPRWGLTRREQREYVTGCISRPEVQDFLPGAAIRTDQTQLFRIIKDCDVKTLMRQHRIENLKDSLRRNRFIYGFYKALKHLK